MLVTRTGQEIAIQESAAPICNRQGRMIGAVIVFHDVTKERRLKRALAYQASHDALTGLINRREFDNRLQAAVQRAQKGEDQHALLYIDLDQFKVVNDTCGSPGWRPAPARRHRFASDPHPRVRHHRASRW